MIITTIIIFTHYGRTSHLHDPFTLEHHNHCRHRHCCCAGVIDCRRDVANGRRETDLVSAKQMNKALHWTSLEYAPTGAVIIAGGNSKFGTFHPQPRTCHREKADAAVLVFVSISMSPSSSLLFIFYLLLLVAVCVYSVKHQVLLARLSVSENHSLDGIKAKLNSKNNTEVRGRQG